jgi:hypothetical protein
MEMEGHTYEEDCGEMITSIHSGQGITTIMRSDEQLLVSACGRTCSIDMQHSRSIVDLQAALQRTLQMEGQAFHICDINGQLLSTDMQVQDAIAQGLTPLCATLPDKSLHHLENRREELAQMQWKLVRDQMTQSANQTQQISRQVNEFNFQIQANQREWTTSIEQLRAEMGRAMEVERVTTKAELQPIQEAVNGAVLLINGERSKRELSVQGFEKHIHGVCDMLDGERASRRQDLAMQMNLIQELKAGLDLERSNRENIEESFKELKLNMMKFRDETTSSFQELREQVRRSQADTNLNITENLTRFVELEDRCAQIEGNLNDASSFNTQAFDKLGERNERLSQVVETMRLSSKHYEGSIANALERTKEAENLVRQHEVTHRDVMGREKQVREDTVRRVQQSFTNDTKKHVGELEKRLTIRLERESAEREKNFQAMIDEVTKLVQDRRFHQQAPMASGNPFSQNNYDAEVPMPTRENSEPVTQQTPRQSFQPAIRPTVASSETPAHEKAMPLVVAAAPSSRSNTPLRMMPGATQLGASQARIQLSSASAQFQFQAQPAIGVSHSGGSLQAPVFVATGPGIVSPRGAIPTTATIGPGGGSARYSRVGPARPLTTDC